jgi:hypothetical protein
VIGCAPPDDLQEWKSRIDRTEPREDPVQEPPDASAEHAILGRISKMVSDEKVLRDLLAEGGIDGETERDRLTSLERELDQCWDLLRQRRALTEAGEDPGGARVRPSSTVEGYRS